MLIASLIHYMYICIACVCVAWHDKAQSAYINLSQFKRRYTNLSEIIADCSLSEIRFSGIVIKKGKFSLYGNVNE